MNISYILLLLQFLLLWHKDVFTPKISRFCINPVLTLSKNGKAYLVTLNVLSKRIHRKTDSPSGGIILFFVRISSAILLITTKKSKRLKSDTKYPCEKVCIDISIVILFYLAFLHIIYQNSAKQLNNYSHWITWIPKAYIFTNISTVNKMTKNRFVTSWNWSNHLGCR